MNKKSHCFKKSVQSVTFFIPYHFCNGIVPSAWRATQHRPSGTRTCAAQRRVCMRRRHAHFQRRRQDRDLEFFQPRGLVDGQGRGLVCVQDAPRSIPLRRCRVFRHLRRQEIAHLLYRTRHEHRGSNLILLLRG